MQGQIGTPASKIRGLAAERGMTQEDVAVFLGRSRNYVGKRYRGQLDFPSSELAQLASHFGVSVSVLFGERVS